MANANAHRHLLPQEVELSRFKGHNYKQSLMLALNWYNNNVSDATLRKWSLEYVKSHNGSEAHAQLKKSTLPDYSFHHVGILSHMLSLGFKFNKDDRLKLDTYVDQILERDNVRNAAPVVAKPKVISLNERMERMASSACAELDALIDNYITQGDSLNVKAFMALNKVSGQILTKVRAHVKQVLSDLKVLNKLGGEKDPQLVEGYSNINRRLIKGLVNELSMLFDGSVQITQRKAQPPLKQVKHLVFMKKDAENGLKSIDAVKLVGAKEVWTYNTRTRVVTVMRGNLRIDGTMIRGLDENTSLWKKVRKPSKYFNRLGRSSKSLNDRFLREKTLERTGVTGRLGKTVILLAAFES